MLPDDEEEVPLREMRRRRDKGLSGKAPEVQVPQSTLMPGTAVARPIDPARTNVTFAIPLSIDCPSGSAAQTSAAPIPTALPSSLFTAYQTPDDPLSAAKDALLRLNLMTGK